MSSALDFQMYIGPNTQIPQPTDVQAQVLMQWDTGGQENGVKFDPSRLVSGFNDLLELRLHKTLKLECWQHHCHGDKLNDSVHPSRHAQLARTQAERNFSAGLRPGLLWRCTTQA